MGHFQTLMNDLSSLNGSITRFLTTSRMGTVPKPGTVPVLIRYQLLKNE